jgi:hypothetical protein
MPAARLHPYQLPLKELFPPHPDKKVIMKRIKERPAAYNAAFYSITIFYFSLLFI